MSAMLAATLLAACHDSSTAPISTGGTVPAAGNPPAGGGGTGGAAPSTAAVTVGDIFYKSALNGTSNAAVDTVAANGTVTWTWASNETLPHGIQSTGSPSFASGPIMSGAGKTYSVTFPTAGTYRYNCSVHGNAMTGTIVVVAAAPSSTPDSTPTSPPPLPPTLPPTYP